MTVRSSRLLVAQALTAALLLAAPAAHAAFPGANGRIAFIRDERVMTVGPDGSGVSAVTSSTKVTYAAPAWSADGKRLVFDGYAETRDGERGYVSDGATIRRLRPGADFAWAPDSARLAAVRVGPKLVVFPVAGGRATTLRSLPAETDGLGNVIADPAWSPDGRWIAFGGGPKPPGPNPTESALFRIRATGGRPQRIVKVGQSPNWSPDGRRIVFAKQYGSRDNIHGSIWTVNADGSAARRLTPDTKDLDTEPAFSPDGKLIVFTRYAAIPGTRSSEPATLMVMSPRGTGLRKLGGGVEGEQPDWQPVRP